MDWEEKLESFKTIACLSDYNVILTKGELILGILGVESCKEFSHPHLWVVLVCIFSSTGL